jgi:RND family efflux transporter MFP subunit
LHCAEIYAAEEEFLQAQKFQKTDPAGEQRVDLVSAAREKLQQLGLTKEQIAKLQEQGKASSRLTLYAPSNGVITEKHANEGATVQAGTQLFTIADPAHLWIELELREEDLGRIELEQPVTLATDAHSNVKFAGRIAVIAPVVNRETRTVQVRVEFSKPDQKLKPGMFVRGDVHTGGKR